MSVVTRLVLVIIGDEGAALWVFLNFVEPGSDVSKAATAERHNILDRRRSEEIGLGNPRDDSAVGVEDRNAAVRRRVGLSFDLSGIDPANVVAATVFKQNWIIKRRESSPSPARNPSDPCAETIEDRDMLFGLDGAG